jgi:methionyl-tRNA formyltransferase
MLQKYLYWGFEKYKEKHNFANQDAGKINGFSIFHNKIFSKKDLSSYKLSYNFHGGSLPDYRGSASPIWSIVNNEKHTSVTVHKIEEKLDSGEVYIVKNIKIDEYDTGQTLYNKLCTEAFKIFKKNFECLINNKLPALKATKSRKGRIYTRQETDQVKNVTNIVRAFHHSKLEKAYYYNKYGKKIELNYE